MAPMPASTFLPEQRVADVVASHPEVQRAFELLGVDYCCGATRTLGVAASLAGIDFDELVELLADDDHAVLSAMRAPEDFGARSLSEQVAHLHDHHHRFARKQLLRLDRAVRRVWSTHRKTPGLARVRALVLELADDLIPHMAREERFLFAYMRSLDGSPLPGDRVSIPLHGNIEYPLASITHDHSEDAARLMELRDLTIGFQPNAESCRNIQALYAGLAELERDLQEHIRIENQVVFPRAVEMERKVRERAASGT